MSLEAAILELAATVRQATVVLASLGNVPEMKPAVVLTQADADADLAGTPRPDSPTVSANATKRGPGRPKKTETPATSFGPANAGDVEGTAYFVCDAHNTVAKFAPTDSLAPVADRSKWVQVTGAAYLEKQTALAKQFPASATTPAAAPAPAASAPSAPTAAAAPPPAAVPSPSAPSGDAPTYASVRTALLDLSVNDPVNGRQRVLDIIKAVGVNAVPELANATPEKLAEAMALIVGKPADTDPLFG